MDDLSTIQNYFFTFGKLTLISVNTRIFVKANNTSMEKKNYSDRNSF